ncbi:MAG: SIMPL domain-containing protein [Candidatus Magasanikbacteria bacterium]|nr:SIMPL domain-containing protein [Candidatus Magasanikbacteria bacterium]
MPNGKKKESMTAPVAVAADDCCGGVNCGGGSSDCGGAASAPGAYFGSFGRKLLATLVGVLLAYLIFYVGTLIHLNLKRYQVVGLADTPERTLSVTGIGKVTGRNDIAVTTLGFSNLDKDVAKAQADNKKVMDQAMAALGKLGIAEADLQSDYNIAPEYHYTKANVQEFKGYRVSNRVTVKIRDLKKIPAVLSLAGQYGINEVGGLSFTIDDPGNLKTRARDLALRDAQFKAARLAAALGVRLSGVISYGEYEGGGPELYGNLAPLRLPDAVGGGGPETIPGGSREVLLNIQLTYKILPR